MKGTMIDVGAWIRVSSGGQDEANQVPDLEGFCGGHGYNIARRYVVHGKSAYHGEQQAALDEALADARAGVIKRLVIWHSDRIERRPGKALLDVLAEFTAAGAPVESVKEPTLGQLDFGGQVLTFISGLVNHEKSAHLAEQVKLAHDRIRLANGLTGRPAWGYKSAGEKYAKALVPTAEGRRVVPEVFARCIAGESQATIAKWLTKKTGKTWWPGTVGTMLRNPVYAGTQVDASGTVILRVAEPLVDGATFLRAGKALGSRPKRGPVIKSERALLSGVLFCGKCWKPGQVPSPMYRIKAGNTAPGTFYYRCTGRGADRKGCGNMIHVADLDAVMDATMADLNRPIMERRVVPGHDHSAELESVQFELRQLPAQNLSRGEEDAMRAKLRSEEDRLAALPLVPDEIVDVDTGQTYAAQWAGLGQQERGDWLRSKGVTMTAQRRRPLTHPRDASHDPDLPGAGFPDVAGKTVHVETPELIVGIRLAGIAPHR